MAAQFRAAVGRDQAVERREDDGQEEEGLRPGGLELEGDPSAQGPEGLPGGEREQAGEQDEGDRRPEPEEAGEKFGPEGEGGGWSSYLLRL